MATSGTRQITITFAGDFEYEFSGDGLTSATNASSPGQKQILTLSAGANTITPPGGGSSPKGVTIIPPTGNTEPITLKGISGDTGVVLHPTDPTSIGLNSPTATFVLTVAAQVVGVVLIWS